MFKFIRSQIRAVGFRRFFLAFSLIVAGIIWQFVQLGGGGISQIVKTIISFWPVFWAIWMGVGIVVWIVSGFKNLAALLFGLIGGGFMAETVLPGVVINKENMPLFFILTGLLILMGRKIKMGGTLYNYNYDGSEGGYFGGYFGKKGGGNFSGKTLLSTWFGGKSIKNKHGQGSKRKHSSRSRNTGASIEEMNESSGHKRTAGRSSNKGSDTPKGNGDGSDVSGS